MNPPMQDLPPTTSERVGDVLEYLAKLLASLAALVALALTAGRKWIAWRDRRRREEIRLALSDELDCIKRTTEQVEEIRKTDELILARQNVIFEDMDLFMDVARGLKDRQDEFSDLLDEVGFASRDRRTPDESDRRHRASMAIEALQERRQARRRRDDEARDIEKRKDD